MNVTMVKLNNGKEMPVFGIGTYASSKGEVGEAIKIAIDAGYRHIDTAYFYANEAEIGSAIKQKIEEGVVKREELFVVTKLWSTFHEPDKVEYACRQSLKNLGLNYIDLYLMHFPAGLAYRSDSDTWPINPDGSLADSDVDYVDTWKAMEKLVKLGLVRSIGISNFNSEQIERLLAVAKIIPVTNQVECSPYINQKKLRKFCTDRNIVMTAYSPLAKGNASFLDDSRVQAIANKYKKTTANVVFRYLIQLGNIIMPKSVTKSRIEENINVFDFELTDDEMEILDSFETGERQVVIDEWKNSKYYPFNIDF